MERRPQGPRSFGSLIVGEREILDVASVAETSSRPETSAALVTESPGHRADVDDEAGAVDALARRLALEHPGVTEARIKQLLGWCLDATTDARVQRFRLVLAERAVRCYLGPRQARAARVDSDPPASTAERR